MTTKDEAGRLRKEVEVAKAAAILLGERMNRIQQACRRAVAMLEQDCGPEAYHARSVLEDALEDA